MLNFINDLFEKIKLGIKFKTNFKLKILNLKFTNIILIKHRRPEILAHDFKIDTQLFNLIKFYKI